jgi:hypothetical protein
MPLSFKSNNKGSVAFGFFNIDSDMLLLENYFFFADNFCEYISKTSENEHKEVYQFTWEVWYIADKKDIGDLMGAIHGVRHTGFIGELYRHFPFPENSADFKQKPEGNNSQEIVKKMIQSYAKKIKIPFKHMKGQVIQIGHYEFDIDVFHELVKYVWQGGYPRWRDEQRPDYVIAMKNNLIKKNKVLLDQVFI